MELSLSVPAVGFGRGFALPLKGLRLSLGVPALRRLSLAMMAITALSLLALLVAVPVGVFAALQAIWPRPGGAENLIWYLAAFAGIALGLVAGAATVPAVLTAPLTDPLVEATERHLGLPGPAPGGLARLARETLGGIAKALLRVAFLIAGHAVLLPLWLLPGAGHATWSVLSVAWSVVWLVFEYLDLPANRFGYRFGEVVAVMRSNVGACAGFGLAVYLLLWVPVVNTLFIPAATVGATMLFHELRATGRLRGGPREGGTG